MIIFFLKSNAPINIKEYLWYFDAKVLYLFTCCIFLNCNCCRLFTERFYKNSIDVITSHLPLNNNNKLIS